MGREGEVVQALIADFERLNPDIRVRVQQIPWSAAHEKLLTAYAGDAMPDVFQLGNTWIPEFVALGAITDLESWMGRSAHITHDDFFAGIMATNVIEGRPYGVPWYVDTRLIFYRKDILKQAGYAEPPHTWDTWFDAMARIKETVGPQNYAILLPINESDPLIVLALQLDAELLTDNDQHANFDSSRFREAFRFYTEIFRNEFAPSVGGSQIANVYQEFARGRFTMYVSGPWNIGEFKRRLPAKTQGRWMTAPMPAPHPHRPGSSIAGGASLVMHRDSSHKREAWKLIEYLCAAAQQIRFYHLTGNLPARKAAWEEAALAEDVYTQAFWAQLQHLKSTPKIPEWEHIAETIARYAEAVIREEMSMDKALAALDTEVERMLEKRRWVLGRSR